MMAVQIKRNEPNAARRQIPFIVQPIKQAGENPGDLDLPGVPTEATGLTFSGADLKISKAGGATANMQGSFTELDAGVYVYECHASEVDTIGALTVIINKTGYFGMAVAEVGPGYDVLGYRTICVAGTRPATLTANTRTKLTALSAGTDGDSITYQQRNQGNNETLSCSVSGANITVDLGTDGSGNVTSTEQDVVTIINQTNTSASIVRAELIGNNATAAVFAQTNLSGGVASAGSDSNSGLSWDQPKATIAGAIAVHQYGDHIVLGPGIHKWTAASGVSSSMALPEGLTLRGAAVGSLASTLRIGANTVEFTTVIIPAPELVIEDLTIDGRQALTSAIYSAPQGRPYGPPMTVYLRRCRIYGRGYGVWMGSKTDQVKRYQQIKCFAEKCQIYAGVSPWALEGTSAVEHYMEARDCYLEADDWWAGGTETNDTGAVSYSVLSVYGIANVINCTCVGRHHHLNRSVGVLHAGAPLEPARPGKIIMFGGSLYAEHTQAWVMPKEIESVSAASPAVVTLPSHGLTNGMVVRIKDVYGLGAMVNINRDVRVSNATADTFECYDAVVGTTAISTVGGTYLFGGHVESGLAWEAKAITDGSEIRIDNVAGAHSWGMVEEDGGQIISNMLMVEEKESIKMGGANGRIIYAHSDPHKVPTYSKTHGWHPRSPVTLQHALVEAGPGDAIYCASPTTPFLFASTLAIPDNVRVHGHGVDVTTLQFNAAAGNATDYALTVAGATLIEDLTITEGPACTGASGIHSRDEITLVTDHVKLAMTHHGIVIDQPGTANVENNRIVAGNTGIVVSAAVTLNVVGEHPTIVATTGIDASASAILITEAQITATTDVAVDNATAYLDGPGADLAKCTTANGGVIRSEENAAAVLLDLPDGIETGFSPRATVRILAAAIAGDLDIAGDAFTYKSLTGAKSRITATATSAAGRENIDLDGSD